MARDDPRYTTVSKAADAARRSAATRLSTWTKQIFWLVFDLCGSLLCAFAVFHAFPICARYYLATGPTDRPMISGTVRPRMKASKPRGQKAY